MESCFGQAVEKLQAVLQAGSKCPMCGHNQFEVVRGWTSQQIQDDLNGFTIGGPSIPCVAVVCKKCGLVSQHALKVLLPDVEAEKQE